MPPVPVIPPGTCFGRPVDPLRVLFYSSRYFKGHIFRDTSLTWEIQINEIRGIMGLVVAPILEGKLEDWKAWAAELMAPRRAELDRFNQRYGLARHDAWISETPMGTFAVVLHEGPGGDEIMAKLGSSTNSFDVWFAGKIKELHGMDLNATPPGPMPECLLHSGSG